MKERKKRGLGLRPLLTAMTCSIVFLAAVFVWALAGSVRLEGKSGHGIGIVEAANSLGIVKKSESFGVAASAEQGSSVSQTLTAGVSDAASDDTIKDKSRNGYSESEGSQAGSADTEESSSADGSGSESEDNGPQKAAEEQSTFAQEEQGSLEEAGRMEAKAVYEQINEATRSIPEAQIVDVTSITSVSAEQVRGWIEEYSFGDWAYLDDAEMSQSDREAILARRNLEAVTDPVTVRYGIITDNAAVRSFPTWRKASSSLDARAFDYFQESMFLTGEPVAVCHQTMDGVWSFVQGPNYRGWVETDHIGFCSLEEIRKWQSSDVAVVTASRVTVADKTLRMGTSLPASEDAQGNLILSVPRRAEDGSLTLSETQVEADSGFHMGYLTLGTEQILTQAMGLVGTDYGWGDSNGDMDCSSTMNAIYRCFGILLPRNTSSMMYTGTEVISMDGMTAEEKKSLIQTLEPGTILLMSGHTVMYVGEVDGVPSILHNFVEYSPDEGLTAVDVYQCRVTPLDLVTGSGSHYLDRYQYAICFSQWYQQD